MKLNKKILIAAAVAFAGCSKDDPPPEDPCLDPSFRSELSVRVDVDRAMEDWQEVDSTRQTTRGDPNCWALRYCVAAYKRDSTTPYLIETSMNNPVKLSLPPDKYYLVGWADHVPDCNGKSHYFFTDDFEEILLRNKYNYIGNDLAKMGYRGTRELRVGWTTTETDIALSPAMGRYKLVATDTADYKVGKVLISYLDLPCSIHGHSGMVNGHWDDVEYESKATGQQLAMDHVLAHPEESYADVRVEIYDDENNLRNRVRKLRIPLKAGGVTTVKGNFFSILDLDAEHQAGGITIDTEFEGTIEIVV